MPLFPKPQFNSVWASTGTKLAPASVKISQGWIVEIPPYEYDNWVQNRQDALLAHINQLGIPVWDQTVEYQSGKSYVQGITSGTIYRALTTNTNINPELDIQGNWSVAFQSPGDALLKSENLADVPNKALARSNLGIATTEFYDGRYLIKSQNFADVPNKSTARTNLDIYSRQEVIDLIDALQPAGQVTYFARTTPPDGWLVCDGSFVSRSTYSKLFSAIGTTFGAGNGSTTFGLPNLLGEFIRGWDNGRGVDPGRIFGSAQSSQNLIHSHPVQDPGHSHGFTVIAYGTTDAGGGALVGGTDRGVGPDGSFTGTTTISGTGISINTSGGAEARPRNIALLPCIKI